MRKENDALYDKLVTENYDKLLSAKGDIQDQELTDMAKLAQGSVLVPQFPGFTKGKYKLANLTRFGNQQQQMHAMQRAIERHEDDLKIEQMMKENDKRDFENSVAFEQAMLENERKNKEEAKKDYKKTLDFQSKHKQVLKEAELTEMNTQPRDPFPHAPSEPEPKLLKFTTSIKGMQTEKNKEDLMDQIQEKKRKTIEALTTQRMEDQAELDKRIADMKAREQSEKAESKRQKETNAKVWIEQTNMDYKAREVQSLFT